jgi:hypothetical protein
MSSENETTTYPAARPTTRRSTQRSNPRRPEHESSTSDPTTKFQPTSHNQDPKSDADPCITIRGGVRADARRHTPTLRGDLGTVIVDLVGGGERC